MTNAAAAAAEPRAAGLPAASASASALTAGTTRPSTPEEEPRTHHHPNTSASPPRAFSSSSASSASCSSSRSSRRLPLFLALVAAMGVARSVFFVDNKWAAELTMRAASSPPYYYYTTTTTRQKRLRRPVRGEAAGEDSEEELFQADDVTYDDDDSHHHDNDHDIDGSDHHHSSSSSSLTSLSSPLESLYKDTSNGIELEAWATSRVMELYPSFPDIRYVRVGTPSLAHDPRTRRTVVGFRVNSRAQQQMVAKDFQYLMLCDEFVVVPRRRSNNNPTTTSINRRWKCQDSGMENAYVPPECDHRHWKAPAVRAAKWMGGHTTIGPEDARLHWDVNGNLGATIVMRGCHPDTSFGNSTPLYSVYSMRWRHTHGRWRVFGYPKLLTIRQSNLSSLGDSYPEATKSWISIPGPDGLHPDPRTQRGSIRYSVGWTNNMSSHVVYQVANATGTLHMVVPTEAGSAVAAAVADYSSLDLDHYRISTNVVEFHGALLAMGHRKVNKVYYHYWYAFCPNAPYSALAVSDLFQLPDKSSVWVSFALGLAHEANYLYLSWSEDDRHPRLSRYDADDVWRAFRNSTFAATRNVTYKKDFVGFADRCRTAANAASGAAAK